MLSNGVRIPTHTLVWTAGVKASPLLGPFGMPLDDRGRVRVDPFLRVEGHERIWALGDCAAVPNERTPGQFDPPTCQHALRQARRLAKNLHGDPQPYGYRMLGQVATLGRYKGIADVLGLRLRGFPAGSSPAATTSSSCRSSPASSASSSTGRPRSSSAATSPSSPGSATRIGSATDAQRSDFSAAVSDCFVVNTPSNRSPSRATRASTASIVNAAGSSDSFTSSQRSGVETGAPAFGRTE